MSQETLYIKIDKNVQVQNEKVCLGEIARLLCTSRDIENRVKVLRVKEAEWEKPGRHAMSIMEIVALIREEFPSLEINNLGESDFIITRVKGKEPGKWAVWLKTAFVCVLAFAGAAFSIMTFNNDVDIPKLFAQLFSQFTGERSDGFTILELSYSVGVGLGILIFFNHFAGRKFTADPTPLEVEMRLYEDDVDKTLIEAGSRKKTGGKP